LAVEVVHQITTLTLTQQRQAALAAELQDKTQTGEQELPAKATTAAPPVDNGIQVEAVEQAAQD
jgi:hypothetical protein